MDFSLVSPKKLIDSGILSYEEWKELTQSYDFEKGGWNYAPPYEEVEFYKEFEETVLATYLKIAHALLPDYVVYERSKVFPVLRLVNYTFDYAEIESEDIFLDNLNCIFKLIFEPIADIDDLFNRFSKN